MSYRDTLIVTADRLGLSASMLRRIVDSYHDTVITAAHGGKRVGLGKLGVVSVKSGGGRWAKKNLVLERSVRAQKTDDFLD